MASPEQSESIWNDDFSWVSPRFEAEPEELVVLTLLPEQEDKPKQSQRESWSASKDWS